MSDLNTMTQIIAVITGAWISATPVYLFAAYMMTRKIK